MFHDNSYNYRITLSRLTFNHIIKIIYLIKYHTIGNIGLELKSSHTIKVLTLRIKCLKGPYYLHLLNNYLINYLNFPDLTGHSIRLSMFNNFNSLKLLFIASTIIMLKRFRSLKRGLQEMVISNEWSYYKEDNVDNA